MDVVQQVLLADDWQRKPSANRDREPETMLHVICDKICGNLGATARLQTYTESIAGIPPEQYLRTLETVLTDLCSNPTSNPEQQQQQQQPQPLRDVAEQRRTEVREAVIERTVGECKVCVCNGSLLTVGVVLALSKRRLLDFDWSIKVVLGSDRVGAVRLPVFVLVLRLEKVEGCVSEETVTLELDQNELAMVLTQLEKPLKAVRSYGKMK